VGLGFAQDGYEKVAVYDANQVSEIEQFAKDWLYRLLDKWVEGKRDQYPLEKYHEWVQLLKVDHNEVFRAKNRHTSPGKTIQDLIINKKVREFIKQDFDIWDEGLGWLAFRFVRPGFGDGYPMSRKEWGPAKKVVSCWIPIIGFNPNETITLVPGSHLKEYKKYLPENSKFMKDEYRLAEEIPKEQIFNPKLNKGEAVFYHPKVLHSEDIASGEITRLSLEYRVTPKHEI
jgi:Phytanoyl-CoA dioxygenase (PhyH)